MSKQNKPSFEEQLESLENIVNRLEDGDLSLDESLTQFEQGVKLTKDCQKILSQAEQKVMLLNENNQLEKFE
jgi:exodeoxyribonuclease VII small subunit